MFFVPCYFAYLTKHSSCSSSWDIHTCCLVPKIMCKPCLCILHDILHAWFPSHLSPAFVNTHNSSMIPDPSLSYIMLFKSHPGCLYGRQGWTRACAFISHVNLPDFMPNAPADQEHDLSVAVSRNNVSTLNGLSIMFLESEGWVTDLQVQNSSIWRPGSLVPFQPFWILDWNEAHLSSPPFNLLYHNGSNESFRVDRNLISLVNLKFHVHVFCIVNDEAPSWHSACRPPYISIPCALWPAEAQLRRARTSSRRISPSGAPMMICVAS